ncbi:hypothetical protein ACHAXR_002432 [Thalassiosira sp. AJA248-18]
MKPPTLHRRGFNSLILSLMIYRRTLFFGAMAVGTRLSFVAAFQSPYANRALRIKLSSLLAPQSRYPYPRPQEIHFRKSERCIASSALHAFTGWINSDTLNLHETIHNNNFSKTDNDSNTINDVDDDTDTKIKYPSPSSVERLLIRDRLVYIKRDDVLHLPSSNISGNKARKFLSLNNIPACDFPDAIVSYGGPQSNAMVALAAIVSSKNAELTGNYEPLGTNDWLLQEQNFREESGGGGGGDMFWQLDVSEEEEEVVNGKKKEHGGSKQASQKGQSTSSSSSSPSTTETVSNTTPSSPKKRFIYYTKPLPRYLRNNPNGNLLRALALGMEIQPVSHDEYNQLFGGLHGGSTFAPADLDPPIPGQSLWLPQGGACSIAKPGSDVLAREIVDYWSLNGKGMSLAVCVPGGTCTTALLLHRSINYILEQRRLDGDEAMDIRLTVIPCVGDDEYAMRQMISLDRSMGGNGRREDMPEILKPRSDVDYGSARKRSKGYFSFGEPAKAILQTYDEMNENGLFLDLLYGAPAWSLLLQHWRSRDSDCPIAGRQVMYVHSGGLEGVASQLTRYKHKGLIDARTIQTT